MIGAQKNKSGLRWQLELMRSGETVTFCQVIWKGLWWGDTLSQDLKEVRNTPKELHGRRAFQAEGRADGEALRHKRECACRRTSGAGEEYGRACRDRTEQSWLQPSKPSSVLGARDTRTPFSTVSSTVQRREQTGQVLIFFIISPFTFCSTFHTVLFKGASIEYWFLFNYTIKFYNFNL